MKRSSTSRRQRRSAVFMVYSLDIALEVWPAGMNRAQFAEQIRGHNVAAGSIVARYQRTIDGRAARASN